MKVYSSMGPCPLTRSSDSIFHCNFLPIYYPTFLIQFLSNFVWIGYHRDLQITYEYWFPLIASSEHDDFFLLAIGWDNLGNLVAKYSEKSCLMVTLVDMPLYAHDYGQQTYSSVCLFFRSSIWSANKQIWLLSCGSDRWNNFFCWCCILHFS